MMMKKEVTDY